MSRACRPREVSGGGRHLLARLGRPGSAGRVTGPGSRAIRTRAAAPTEAAHRDAGPHAAALTITLRLTFLGLADVHHLLARRRSPYSLCWNLLPRGSLLAAARDARFAVMVGGAMIAGNALLLLRSRRLRAIA